MRIGLRNLILAAAAVVVLAAAGAALFVHLGIYDVAATRQHTRPVFDLLEYAQRRAVSRRAGPAPDLADSRRVQAGARIYSRHCLQCHGAPGIAPDALAYGMTPEPANLVATAREWPAGEIYWVVRHGIKMTGMPAWNRHLSDEEMWDVVAFVMALPQMSPSEYATFDPQARERNAAPAEAAPQPPPMAAAPDRVTPAAIGDIEAGRRAIDGYLCATCHVIPGVVGAQRAVGPPLAGIAGRRYIAGIAVNTPENMIRWLRDPQRMDPLSAMPNLGVSEQDARDIAAYLYTLEDPE